MPFVARRVDSSLHLVVREELQARHWSHATLADKLGVRSGVVSRWLTDDPPPKRVVPLPQACVQIADVLELDAVEVFRAAGYLPVNHSPNQAHTDEIKAAARRVERVLAAVPEEDWHQAYQITLAYLDGLQILLNRLEHSKK